MAGQSDNRYGDRGNKPLTNQPIPTTTTTGTVGDVIIDTNGITWTLKSISAGLYYWYKDGDFSNITTQSTSSTTGALVVGGGIGLSGDIHAAGVEVTVTGKNKHRTYLSDGSSALFRRQIAYWDGSSFLANEGNFFGRSAGQSTSGFNCNSIGTNSMFINTGNTCNSFGSESMYSNTGNTCNSMGHLSMYSNTGNDGNTVGYLSMYYNNGNACNNIGYAGFRYNNWDNSINIGSQSSPIFIENASSVKSFTYTEITANTITITGHGFGTTGRKINLKFKTTAGTPPTGLVNNTIYQFTLTSADIITLTGIGTNASADFAGTLTNSIDTSNSISIGNNVTATKKNQTTIGNSSMTEVLLYGASREYADNAAAVAAGMSIGSLYRTGDLLKIVH